ncbi:hypothetical protein CLOP_g8410, partial [Closterium sp. NIES-67]
GADDVAREGNGVANEIDYVASLNRALPDDIRVLAWAPAPSDFSARFSCLEREYRYYFVDEPGLDILAMQRAAELFKGRHDFRNVCKMDVENVKSFERDIMSCRIVPFAGPFAARLLPSLPVTSGVESNPSKPPQRPSVWVLQVVGTAFLWHQIRCMMAVLLMVGRGQERPEVVSELLRVHDGPFTSKPQYAPADPHGLVLHRCAFPASLRFSCSANAKRLLCRSIRQQLNAALIRCSVLQSALDAAESAAASSAADPSEFFSEGEGGEKKLAHIPLHRRPREPSLEERRKKLEERPPRR